VKRQVALAWSGGKDSALALYRLRADPGVEVVSLLTTVTEDYDRVSMHGIRRDVLLAQGEAIGLPVEVVGIRVGADDGAYAMAMAAGFERLQARWSALKTMAFGDIFLEDVRAWREARLAEAGWNGLFPLWGEKTRDLAYDVTDLGIQATICCVDTRQLAAGFSGREYDTTLLAELPAGVDPCAERGEFHTCVHAGPVFRAPLRLRKGGVVLRDERFAFCDLTLAPE